MSRSHQLDRIIGKAESLHGHLPATRARLKWQASTNDSTPSHYVGAAPDTTPNPNTPENEQVELTAVEAAADRLAHNRNNLHQIDQLINDAEQALANAVKLCQRILDIHIEGPALCDGRGLEGFDAWGRACYRAADKAGLCSACYMSCYRWRVAHDKPSLRPSNDAA